MKRRLRFVHVLLFWISSVVLLRIVIEQDQPTDVTRFCSCWYSIVTAVSTTTSMVVVASVVGRPEQNENYRHHSHHKEEEEEEEEEEELISSSSSSLPSLMTNIRNSFHQPFVVRLRHWRDRIQQQQQQRRRQLSFRQSSSSSSLPQQPQEWTTTTTNDAIGTVSDAIRRSSSSNKTNHHHLQHPMNAMIHLDNDENDNYRASSSIETPQRDLKSSTSTTGCTMMTAIALVCKNWWNTVLQNHNHNNNTGSDDNHDHRRVLDFVLVRQGFQYGIILYLIIEFSKVLRSTIDEFNQSLLLQLNGSNINSDIDNDDDDNNIQQYQSQPSPAYRKYPQQIHEIVLQLHQQQQQQSTNINVTSYDGTTNTTDTAPSTRQPVINTKNMQHSTVTKTTTNVYQTIYTLAQWLHSAGIPYINPNPTTTTSTTTTTVESLLMELTHPEIALLQQCLYIIPDDHNYNSLYNTTTTTTTNSTTTMTNYTTTATTYTNNHNGLKHTNNDNILFRRRNLIGLESIHEQIVDTIQNSLGRNNIVPSMNDVPSINSSTATRTTTTTNVEDNPFASLFQDVPSSTSKANSKNNIGILLYGPPGCGKTNLIRTLVRTLQLPCIVVTPSILLRKYVGETNLHIRTLFHMIQSKLSPCILCIDELDGLFRERQHDNEHEVNRELKTEFLQWMDGMMTTTEREKNPRDTVIMIGATNRPFDVDAAILRRLSHTYYIGLPNRHERSELLQQFLQPIPNTILLTSSKQHQLSQIVSITARYTPSDLRQLLQMAAISGPMKRRETSMRKHHSDRSDPVMLTMNDVFNAMAVIGPTPLTTSYAHQMCQFRNQRNPVHVADRFGHQTVGSRNSLYMKDDEDDNDSQGNKKDRAIDRSFSSPFNHRNDLEDDTNADDNDDGTDRWETIFGNYYNLGTLEVDQTTLDLLVQYISEVLQQSDDTDSNGDDSSDNNSEF